MRLFTLIATVVFAGSGCSQPPPEPVVESVSAPKLIDSFDSDLITRLFVLMDYERVRTGEAASGDILLEFIGPAGEGFTVEERHCASHKPGVTCACIMLSGRIAIDPEAGLDSLEHVNSFNHEQAAVYMFVDGDDIVVSDDIILDGGVSEANLQSALAAFSFVLRTHRDYLLRTTGKSE